MNGFKAVNDNFGHLVGDVVLKAAADRLATRVRTSDTVSRTGGDEFTVLAEVTDWSGADNLAAALRRVLAQPISHGADQIMIGASIGVAIYPDDGGTMDHLMAAADRMMYLRKGSER
jgi:diguanylate cyclase (GGDEF)-like protein